MELATLQALQLASWPWWETGLSGKMQVPEKEPEHQQALGDETCRLIRIYTVPSSHNKNSLSLPIILVSIIELAAFKGSVIKQFSHMQNKW